MTEVETLLAHLRELEFKVHALEPGHPPAWTIAAYGGPSIGIYPVAHVYALESGRILSVTPQEARFEKILADVFGPDFKTLAQVCGGQAPTIGRVVHVWMRVWLGHGRQYELIETPFACIIEEVYDDGAIDVTLDGECQMIKYGAPAPSASVGTYDFWTWPRQIR